MAVRSISDLPGPRRLPLLGNAHQVRPDTLHLTAEKWARRYGPLYRFDIGRRKIVVVGKAETLNSLLRDRPDGFRRWREILQITEEVGKVGVFAAEGDDWRRTRRHRAEQQPPAALFRDRQHLYRASLRQAPQGRGVRSVA